MPPLFSDHHSNNYLMENEHRNFSKIPYEGCVKCVLVGDGAVGKTSLVVSYTTNGYPTEYVPTAYDNYNVRVTVDEHPMCLQLCDTAGQDDFDTLRPLCYPKTDVFLLCFSVVSPTSFYNVSDKWIPEIRHHNPQTPIVLVGTQCDLRTDVKVLIDLANYQEQPVTEAEARSLAQRLGVSAYIECSALTQKNLKEVFDTAILLVVQRDDTFQKKINGGKIKNGKKMKRTQGDDVVLCSDKWLQEQNGPIEFKKKKGWKKFLCFTS